MPAPPSVTPASTVASAPAPICSAPISPEAVPASIGRTLIAAATALGWVMPLPIATSAIGRKKPSRLGGASSGRASASSPPATVTMLPIRSIRPVPSRPTSRAAVKVPLDQPTETIIMAIA